MVEKGSGESDKGKYGRPENEMGGGERGGEEKVCTGRREAAEQAERTETAQERRQSDRN